MRQFILKITGTAKYVDNLKRLNEHLSAEMTRLAGELNEHKENERKLYNTQEELIRECELRKNQLKQKTELIAAKDKVMDEVYEDNKHLGEKNEELLKEQSALRAQCAKFCTQLQSLRGTISALKRKLAKYEPNKQ